jgi:hypothetical protein
MPKLKLNDRDRRMIVELKDGIPCVTNATLARIFRCSPSRVSEVVRNVQRDRSKT